MANPGDLVGRQVGRYTVVRHLASGGMAELFIARQEAVGGFEKQLVLKILQPRYATNPRVVTDVPRRGAAGGQAEPPEHRPRLRRRRRGGHQVHRHGVHPRRDDHGHRQARAWPRWLPAAGARRAHRPADGRRPRLRPRAARAPTARRCASSTATSRPRTSWSATRADEDRRLRHRPRAGRAARGGGHAPGQGVVHVARAGARRDGRTTARTSSRSGSSFTR